MVGDQAFPGFLPQHPQARVLVNHFRYPSVMADFFLDLHQVVVKSEVVLQHGNNGSLRPGSGMEFYATVIQLTQPNKAPPHNAGEPGFLLPAVPLPPMRLPPSKLASGSVAAQRPVPRSASSIHWPQGCPN